MSDHEISFLKAFNAKEMPDSEVARTFVSSSKFSILAGAWHALILGPRGSGKTTLLKMLRLPALRLWAGEEADSFRKATAFTGVFVPADITWTEMMEALGRRKLPQEIQESIVMSLFSTNVFLALVEAFEARITPTKGAVASTYRCASDYDRQKMADALRNICSHWHLKPQILSLTGMKTALQARLLLIQSEVTKQIRKSNPSLENFEKVLDFIYLPPISSVEVAVEQFDSAIDDPSGKWALLFDEFEIAPVEMQSLVFRRFRSAGNKVFYKVGLAPCTAHTMSSLAEVSEATPRNDYRIIELWYPYKKSARKFSEQLFTSMVSNTALAKLGPIQVFGPNHLANEDEDEPDTGTQPYGKGIFWQEVFESLERKDPSFAKYLEEKKISTVNLDTAPDTPTGNTIRKIAPLVAFRDAFMRENGHQTAKRGRKKLNFAYSGWEAISAICEGNPRWLIGIVNMMLAAEPLRTSNVKPSTQVDKLKEATESYSSMLEMIPLESRGIVTKEPVDELLKKIGEYFFARLVKDEFSEEPPLSFLVDEYVSPDIQAAIRIAINHGAIINIAETQERSDGFANLVGKRFRLAYLLAPRFKLPLRSTKWISLTRILSDAKNDTNMENLLPNSSQLSLL